MPIEGTCLSPGAREREPALVRAEVEADDVDALRREHRTRPRADTAERARDEEALCAAQYVARPPEMSKQAPVEKLISSLASQQTSAATSSGRPIRANGIRDVMYETCSSVI